MMIGREKSCTCWIVVFSFTVCYTCAFEGGIPQVNAFHDHRFFLREIFDKYGDNGIITFEGFEHLLENLGLGRLSFEKKHNVSMHRINGSFQDVHDALRLHDHRHDVKGTENSYFKIDDNVADREAAHFTELDEVLAKTGDLLPSAEDLRSTKESTKVVKRNAVEVRFSDSPKEAIKEPDDSLCLSPQALLQTFGLRPNHSVAINPSRFLHLCPAIVYQLDRRACSVTATPTHLAKKVPREIVDRSEAWLYATLATAVISSVGLLAVMMVKLTRRRSFLHFLIALAVGTLGGDALLHLLPHALLSEDIDHETAAIRCGATFMAILFFYVIEVVLLLVKSPRQKKLSVDTKKASFELKSISPAIGDAEEGDSMMAHHNHSHGLPEGASPALAFLILVGDGLHNLTDGLAIGASFATDPVAGLATSIAVFCHELPHELGDFAVLINSGMSVKRALLYNLLSSGLSFIGAAIGLWLGEFGAASHWIYAVTAGTFLYIAFADLLPEMMLYVKSDGKFHGIFIQLAGISSGGTLMLLIALHEDKLHQLLV